MIVTAASSAKSAKIGSKSFRHHLRNTKPSVDDDNHRSHTVSNPIRTSREVFDFEKMQPLHVIKNLGF